MSVPRAEWPFHEVLPDEHSRPLETVSVYCTKVEPKDTSVALKFAQKSLPPLQNLEHCKRVRRTVLNDNNDFELTLILCLESAISRDRLNSLLEEKELTDKIKPEIVPVCRYAPVNRAQYEAWKHVWPMNYREDTRLDPRFTKEDIDRIEMHLADLRINSSVVKARVVDPVTNTILADALDTRDAHPLKHAIMNCIQAVADRELRGPAHPPSKRKAEDITEGKESYLCSGYDLFINYEPCAMCSMALVHSRIGRVFYEWPTRQGCLGTLYKIHSHPSLNHHYRVFRLKDEPHSLIDHA